MWKIRKREIRKAISFKEIRLMTVIIMIEWRKENGHSQTYLQPVNQLGVYKQRERTLIRKNKLSH